MVWWGSQQDERRPGRRDGAGWLALSQELYDEVLAHPVPLGGAVAVPQPVPRRAPAVLGHVD